VNAAVLTAGPDVIHRSVPNKSTRSFLALTQAGFPIGGLSPFRINVVITLAVRERSYPPTSRCLHVLGCLAVGVDCDSLDIAGAGGFRQDNSQNAVLE
jgi:hypothetical protein